MRMGNMGYISFDIVFYKGAQKMAEGPHLPSRENSDTSNSDEI